MINYKKQIDGAKKELLKNKRTLNKKKKRVTRLVRLEVTKYELLKHYAKEEGKSMSKVLDKIFYSYEINNLV